MADAEENSVGLPSESRTNLLCLGSDELISGSRNCEVISSKPVTAFSCTFETSEKGNLMPLDLFSVYNSTHHTESLEDSGLFNVLGDNMVVCPEQLESYSSSEEEILSNKDLTLDKDEIARDLLRNERQDHEMSLNDLIDNFDVKTSASTLLPCDSSENTSSSSISSSDDSSLSDTSAVDKSLFTSPDSLPSSTASFDELSFRESEGGGDDDFEDDEDDDGVCIGAEHQAVIPDLLSPSSRYSISDCDERLLWDPSVLPEQDVEAYCCQVLKQNQQNLLEDNASSQAWSDNNYIRDDEQALYLLLQCGYNVDEAIRRRRCESIPPLDVMKLWTSEECENFEIGLRLYRKNFFEIRRTKFRTRSVKELVHFYYHWKKINRRKAKLLVGNSSNSDVMTSAASSIQLPEISQVPNYSQYKPPRQPQFADVASSSNHSSHDAPHSVYIQEFTQNPLAHSSLYPEPKHQGYSEMSMTNSSPPLNWSMFRVDRDSQQSEMDFTFTSRPNCDAVSVTSLHGLPVYGESNCYANQVQNQSLFPGQLYADGFPELCFHKPVFLNGSSGDSDYPILSGDICLDVSMTGHSPFRHFRSCVEYHSCASRYAVTEVGHNGNGECWLKREFSSFVD